MAAPPFAYFGGKTRLAQRIVGLLPPHEHYVEPYAGSLAVLLTKPRSRMETVNDLDGDLMTFWRVLREQPEELAAACALTPHSRAEHQAAYDLNGARTDLERARRVWGGHPRRGASGRVRLVLDASVFGVADGFPTRLDQARLQALGNSVVPAVSEYIGRLVLSSEERAA